MPNGVGRFTLSTLVVAASVYLALDMQVPFPGPIQNSDAPLRRALAQMQTYWTSVDCPFCTQSDSFHTASRTSTFLGKSLF